MTTKIITEKRLDPIDPEINPRWNAWLSGDDSIVGSGWTEQDAVRALKAQLPADVLKDVEE